MLCLLFCLLFSALYAEDTVKITGIFRPHDTLERQALNLAVEKFNARRAGARFHVSTYYQELPIPDALKSAAAVCDAFLLNSIAIFGPNDPPARDQVSSLCNLKNIPNFLLRSSIADASQGNYVFNIQPPLRSVGKAVLEVVRYYGWRSYVIIYQDDDRLLALQDVLLSHSLAAQVAVRRMPVRKALGRKEPDFRPLLKEIREVMQEPRMIVAANTSMTQSLLRQAANMNMMGEYYHYIFADLDVYATDLMPYKAKFRNFNFTAIKLINDNHITQDVIRNLTHEHNKGLLPRRGLPTSVALAYDAAMFYVEALHRVMLAESLSASDIWPRLTCQNHEIWQYGPMFLEQLRQLEMSGTTGLISFDDFGNRESYEYSIVELTAADFFELARWNDTHGMTITKNFTKSFIESLHNLENKTLTVTVYLEEPFVMLKQNVEALTGNDRFEGYCVDLLSEISKILNFNYTIREVKDHTYGQKDSSGKWGGMVGELMRGEAHLAVSSLTISYSRSEVIDFTVPFMHLGISIIFKKPEKKDPSLFTFLSPLSLDVWIYMLAAFIGVSLTLWILARFSPYEWYNPNSCNEENDVVENQFTLMNSLWFTVGSLMQQGCDIAPRAPSTRLVAGTWWFFTLILISSYTANLAAFLTVERMVSPIESAEDLAKQTQIKYGSLGSGSTMAFFKESQIQTYSRMWAFMESTIPSPFVNSTAEGLMRVRQGNYAYLMESSMLEYYVERECDLVQIGGLLDSKGYGIGLPKGSPYRELISAAILMLQEKTKLTALKEKWWKRERGGGVCSQKDKSSTASELGLASVGGVFVFLLFGLVLALILALLEFIYSCRRKKEKKRTLWQEMIHQVRFAFKCHTGTTPAPVVSPSKACAVHKKSVAGEKLPSPYVPSCYAFGDSPTPNNTMSPALQYKFR